VTREYEEGDYMEVLNESWEHLVCNLDGNLNLELVARELRDYSLLTQCTSEVYENILNVSKPFANPQLIIQAIHQKIDVAREEAREKARQCFD
jgi:hypothetical protein